ncbi:MULTISPECIES: hypothetical protein [unclassified Xanthobacter]|uniref:hypothetical protein n=1 Tax=unclassified Xanthobacter TaxID=2623496 RepID=UPI001F22D4ED
MVGPGACGKNTLLKMIVGFQTVLTSEITVDGAIVRPQGIEAPQPTVPEGHRAARHTVERNVGLGLRLAG